MPKYLAFTKLLSQPVFDEFNLSDYYTWVKDYTVEQRDSNDMNDHLCACRLDDKFFLFSYNQSQQKLIMRQLNAIPTWGEFHTASFITNAVSDKQVDSKVFLAPELSLFNSRRAICQTENYFTLLVYLMSKFNLSLDELSTIMTQSLLETEDAMDVFKIPYTGKMKNSRRQGFFSFVNNSTNNLLSHMDAILDDLDSNRIDSVYLSAYFRLCIPSMKYGEIEEFLANIDLMKHRLRNLPTYTLPAYNFPAELLSLYYDIYQVMQDEAKEREAFLLHKTVQTITFDTWKHNAGIREQINKGARVNIMIDMGSEW